MPKMNEEVFKDILEKIAGGKSLNKICGELKIAEGTFRFYRNKSQDRITQYTQAKQVCMTSRVDKAYDIALDTKIDPQSKRILVDLIKWESSKLVPKIFGDKITQEITGKDGKDIDFGIKDMIKIMKEADKKS